VGEILEEYNLEALNGGSNLPFFGVQYLRVHLYVCAPMYPFLFSVNWPNAFLVLLFALYLFNNVGSSYSSSQDDSAGGLIGADSASRAAAYLSGEVLDVPTNGEYTRLLSLHTQDTGLPVVVDFYSQSCGPCRQIAPYYKALAKDMAGEAVFFKVDVNKNRATATEAQVCVYTRTWTKRGCGAESLRLREKRR